MTVVDLQIPWKSSDVSLTRMPEAPILEALKAVAFADADVASRAESLFMFLRKKSGQRSTKEYLMGIQHLAFQGDPAGARLLAAFVDVSTPGDRLLPRVKRFSSSRRLKIRFAQSQDDQGSVHQDWLQRLDSLTERCQDRTQNSPPINDSAPCVPGCEPPWPNLQDTLELLVARLSLGDDFEPAERQLLVELLRLEVDAWQERISHLAGSIDPFRLAAITRVLPVLSQADSETRDLRQMITWIEEGCQGADFERPLSRSLDILEDNDRAFLREALSSDPQLAPLSSLFEGLEEHPVRVPVMAHCIKVLMSLAEKLSLLGVPGVKLDLVTSAQLVQTHFPVDGDETEFLLPLTPGFPKACEHILKAAQGGMGKDAADLSGLMVRGQDLILTIPEGGAFLEHDLPAAQEVKNEDGPADEIMAWAEDLQAKPNPGGEEDEVIDPNDATVTELKNLVLTNLQSISVLLGFLRNPKVVAIPGLVEEVVHRTRNPKVIETIAQVRILHTGFANRSVPLACLRSPVNIPISVLRKFMHVKYVSKVDLKRLALDKAGIRKEVNREIKKYLSSLA